MGKRNQYHQPVLEKRYQNICDELETLEKSLESQSRFFGMWNSFFSAVKRILFYELPIEFKIEDPVQKTEEKTLEFPEKKRKSA